MSKGGATFPNPITFSDGLKGVRVGQVTVGNDGEAVRKGVTVILPRDPAEIHVPCYAGMYTLNGNGEVSGSYQIKDWGYTNTVRCTTSTAHNPQLTLP